MVIGADARNILASEANAYIFGYTICNDVSARNRQRERSKMGQPYAYAKNFATFCPMGPWVVTKKEVGDPANLKMAVRINGKTTREGNSGNMIFSTHEVVAYCSDYAGLEAGDIISLGTFAGEKQIYAGDEVEVVTVDLRDDERDQLSHPMRRGVAYHQMAGLCQLDFQLQCRLGG